MVKAIDMHIHPPKEPGTPATRFHTAMAKYFKSPPELSLEELAAKYKELDFMAVILANDDRTAQGDTWDSNDWVASITRQYPDTFIGFGSVDPWMGKLAIKEVERASKELGMKGIKFIHMTQEFYPNERRFYPIYEKIAELGMVAMFHTGTTGVGAGLPGGGGVHLKYTKPIPYIDDVAADLPELTIIMAHQAFPVGGGAAGCTGAQAERLHGHLGVVAQVLQSAADPVRQHTDQAQGAVRLRLPRPHPRALDPGLRRGAVLGRGSAADPFRKCEEGIGYVTRARMNGENIEQRTVRRRC